MGEGARGEQCAGGGGNERHRPVRLGECRESSDFPFAERPAFGASEVVAQRIQVEVPLARDGFEVGRGQADEVGRRLLDAGHGLRETTACQALPAASGPVTADLSLQPVGATAQDDLGARGSNRDSGVIAVDRGDH
jgi:hypothetical protein